MVAALMVFFQKRYFLWIVLKKLAKSKIFNIESMKTMMQCLLGKEKANKLKELKIINDVFKKFLHEVTEREEKDGEILINLQ
jgi:hypothetical protein